MMNGTIKTLVEGKPFGFITRPGEEKDIFFHESALQGVTLAELNEGDAVTFEIVEGKDGRSAAANVSRA
jgi:cold shock protein